jgi:hypothetical protein
MVVERCVDIGLVNPAVMSFDERVKLSRAVWHDAGCARYSVVQPMHVSSACCDRISGITGSIFKDMKREEQYDPFGRIRLRIFNVL